MKSKVSNRGTTALNIASIVFVGIFFIRAIAALFGNSYDWDIDHEMYFGTRLLNGELLYTGEYHDKLPIVQYFFLWPAAVSSVHAWASISIASCVTAALALRRSLIVMVSQGSSLADSLARSVAGCGASYYLFLVSSLPGSLTHINPAATSFSLLSIYLLLCASALRKLCNRTLVLALSAVCASVAISIRPYMAPSIVMLGIWISSRTLSLTSISIMSVSMKVCSVNHVSAMFKRILLFTIFFTLLIFLSGVFLNVIPYLYHGDFDAFVDGIRHNSQILNPQSTFLLLMSQARDYKALGAMLFITSLFAIMFNLFVLFNSLSFMIRGSLVSKAPLPAVAYVDIIFLGSVSLVLLELTILSRHYWSHYMQLFSPYLAISFAFGIVYMYEGKVLRSRLKFAKRLTNSMLVIILVALSSSELSAALYHLRNIHRPHHEASILLDIDTVVAHRTAAGLPTSFLDASHMYAHWKRNESRHGFPHAANFKHFGMGWFDGLDRKSKGRLAFPYDHNDLCKGIHAKGPSLVFVRENSMSRKCFDFATSSYQRLSFPALATPGLVVYERNSDN